ncbi:hypothetical protein BLNAU_19156 [Blattamonas nauphoetae]|uniref:Uncharacterized protein n=1 Tax=Blattamonas nauphoetae TaxID=2049346 RepID=A0ABQ9WX10_9EUKA|nr:hypothetical protein BLNAU_21010 [Blattamonas nauphoetae]KAK2945939.1 hypothetical protein BLNAU_19156 [Blattamonas nauphoetae]
MFRCSLDIQFILQTAATKTGQPLVGSETACRNSVTRVRSRGSASETNKCPPRDHPTSKIDDRPAKKCGEWRRTACGCWRRTRRRGEALAKSVGGTVKRAASERESVEQCGNAVQMIAETELTQRDEEVVTVGTDEHNKCGCEDECALHSRPKDVVDNAGLVGQRLGAIRHASEGQKGEREDQRKTFHDPILSHNRVRQRRNQVDGQSRITDRTRNDTQIVESADQRTPRGGEGTEQAKQLVRHEGTSAPSGEEREDRHGRRLKERRRRRREGVGTDRHAGHK